MNGQLLSRLHGECSNERAVVKQGAGGSRAGRAEKLAGCPGGANTALLVPSGRKPAPLLIGGEFESLPAHHFPKGIKNLTTTF